MPAYAYEKTSSGEIINRITQDTDTLNFAFSQLISMFSSLVGSFILIIYIFLHSWIIGLEILFFLTVLFLILKRYNPILKTIHKERKKEQDEFTSQVTESVRGIIEFKNVTFSYPDEEVILKNFNLKLQPNQKIAIVGKSGQGNSTLFNLITRVFESNKGEILLDVVNIKNLTEQELRKQISIIRQEPFIFNRTIQDNFKLVDSKIKLKEIKEYSKVAYLDEYIMSLPEKYKTKLGEGGVNLSGGQKQRLSIARTLSKNSKIILFDEATSALDNSSQNYIKKAIDHLVKDHTVVIVAHRLSTIIDADIIYVVDGGKISASGKHDELLKKSKVYRTLYDTESIE